MGCISSRNSAYKGAHDPVSSYNNFFVYVIVIV